MSGFTQLWCGGPSSPDGFSDEEFEHDINIALSGLFRVEVELGITFPKIRRALKAIKRMYRHPRKKRLVRLLIDRHYEVCHALDYFVACDYGIGNVVDVLERNGWL